MTHAAATRRVLLVEDSEDETLIMMTVLDQLGYACTVAKNGDEAVANVKQGGFDLVLMDVHLPGTDGLKATRDIRAWEKQAGKDPNIIIGLTGMLGDEDAFKKAGMNACLIKPFHVADLQRKLLESAA